MSRAFFSLDWKEKYFLAFQPLCVREGVGWCPAELAWFYLGCILIE
jgi:hypothetical protein